MKITIAGGSMEYLGTYSEMSGLGMELDVYTYEEGGANDFIWKLPKQMKWPNIVLKYGMTDDRTLEKWMMKYMSEGKRAELQIGTKLNAGQPAKTRWSVREAFPVKWTGPTFSASQNQIALETLEIAHHGLTIVEK